MPSHIYHLNVHSGYAADLIEDLFSSVKLRVFGLLVCDPTDVRLIESKASR